MKAIYVVPQWLSFFLINRKLMIYKLSFHFPPAKLYASKDNNSAKELIDFGINFPYYAEVSPDNVSGKAQHKIGSSWPYSTM